MTPYYEWGNTSKQNINRNVATGFVEEQKNYSVNLLKYDLNTKAVANYYSILQKFDPIEYEKELAQALSIAN